jgi:hypothetical protein
MDKQLLRLIEVLNSESPIVEDVLASKLGLENRDFRLGPITLLVGSVFVSGMLTTERNYYRLLRQALVETPDDEMLKAFGAVLGEAFVRLADEPVASGSVPLCVYLVDVTSSVTHEVLPLLCVKLSSVSAWSLARFPRTGASGG